MVAMSTQKARSKSFPGLFSRYPKTGSKWLCTLPVEERKAFSELGQRYADHGKLGGKARAGTAKRDSRGRFIGGKQ